MITLEQKQEALTSFERGKDSYEKGDYDLAIKDFTESIELDPNLAWAYNNRGISYYEKEEYDLALNDFTEAIRLDPKYALAYNNRGNAFHRKKEYDLAIKDYNEAIRLNPTDATAYYNRGKYYEDKKMYDKAIEDNTEAIKCDPNFAKAYYNRGKYYHEKKEPDLALEDYTKAIKLNPNDAVTYYNRGLIYEEKEEYEKAIKDYAKSIMLDPNLSCAYSRLENINNENTWKNKHDFLNNKKFDLSELLQTSPVQENKEKSEEKNDFLFHLYEVAKTFDRSKGINDTFFEHAKPHLDFLSQHLHITQTGAMLFSVMVSLYEGSAIYVKSLTKSLHLKVIEIFTYLDELEILEQKGLIHINRAGKDFRTLERMYFELRFDAIDSIRKGIAPEIVSGKNLSIDKFFIHLERLCEERVQKKQSYQNIIKLMRNLLNDNEHLVFVQKIQKLSLSDDDILILLRFFHYTVTVDEPEMGFLHFETLYDHSSDFSPIRRQLRNGDHILIKKELIENTCADGFTDTEYFCLTDSVKEEFLVELDNEILNMPVKGLRRSCSISNKNLFYPEKTRRAIEELTSLLQPEHFISVQKRLFEKGMRSDFACLFSGSPGTGKTETTFQIARLTGRDIMHVEISSTKSKWFGESEKQIKKVFDKYRYCVKKSEITPILLFNEADAVFGKRQLLGENRDGLGQTENAIQNIILSEIENLNGILIATTNLQSNMDTAFERRFLYKINFEKPETETRKAIWCSLITDLSDNNAEVLASRFNFSGGQIENIARKTIVHKMLSDKHPALEDLLRFCDEECLSKENMRKIGFRA
jgi:tetratricopeptide (TPR) repeat protein